MAKSKLENRAISSANYISKIIQNQSGQCVNFIKDTTFDATKCPLNKKGGSAKVKQICNQNFSQVMDTIIKDIDDLIDEITSSQKAGLLSSTSANFITELKKNREDLIKQSVKLSGINVAENVRVLACGNIEWDQTINQVQKSQLAALADIKTRLQTIKDVELKGFNPLPAILAIAGLGLIIFFIIKEIKTPPTPSSYFFLSLHD